MIDFLTIILLIFGVLQIILFFKVWGMTNFFHVNKKFICHFYSKELLLREIVNQ